MSSTAGDISLSCLCCRFLTNKNLFLPNQSSQSPLLLPQHNTDADDRNSDHHIIDDSAQCDDVDDTARTVIMEGVDSESNLCNPLVAWQRIQRIAATNKILLVDTHTHAHLERHEVATDSNSSHIYSQSAIPSEFLERIENVGVNNEDDSRIAVMSCAVDIDDWERCLEYATKSNYRIPALGIHPWYVESVLTASNNGDDKNDMELYFTATTTWWLDKLEDLLKLHPGCMVGEIGLCKVARFIRTYKGGKQAALRIQRHVFQQQLRLAAKYCRPVSIHCVNQHGVLLDVFNSLQYNEDDDDYSQIPPVMALHSYTGTVHHVQALLRWEKQAREYQKSTSIDPLIYFGFSHSVNYIMCTSTKAKRQGMETLRSIPRNRILVESDVHCSEHVPLGAAGTIAYIAHVLNESIENVAAFTTQNGLRFFSSIKFEERSYR